MSRGENSPKGMLSTALAAKPEAFKPKPRAKPPATIQMTLQLICSKSRLLITPVRAKTQNGIRATVLALIPVKRSDSQSRMVTMNVTTTTHEWKPFSIPPSIFSSTVFWVKGKNFSSKRQLMNSSTTTSGNMNIIH